MNFDLVMRFYHVNEYGEISHSVYFAILIDFLHGDEKLSKFQICILKMNIHHID